MAKNRFVLPAVLLAAVSLAGLFALGAGADAADRAAQAAPNPWHCTINSACTIAGITLAPGEFNPAPCAGYATAGVTSSFNSGGPRSSVRVCKDDKLVAYGDHAITYVTPPSVYVSRGDALFQQYCSSCHGRDALGGVAGVDAPDLRGVSPATVDFWVTTGRMPAAEPKAVQQTRKPPKLTSRQALEVAAYIQSLLPATPYIPQVNLSGANLADGASLFSLNCAACHTITGAGDALAKNTYAPSLHVATVQQVAEAIRTGPANMPTFSGNLSDDQVRDIVAYVTQKIQHPTDPGGNGLSGVGPVTEGFVGLLFGVGGLMLICFWIGDRSKPEPEDQAHVAAEAHHGE